jgi:metal transporter CNNM
MFLISGILRIKQLIGVDFNKKSLRNLGIELRQPLIISPKVKLLDLLREFRKGRSHIALLTEQVSDLQNKLGLNRANSIDKNKDIREMLSNKNITILGIITLEDVIEKMINLDILDEDDYETNRKQFLNHACCYSKI